jgi:hypothetical protein
MRLQRNDESLLGHELPRNHHIPSATLIPQARFLLKRKCRREAHQNTFDIPVFAFLAACAKISTHAQSQSEAGYLDRLVTR